MDVYTDWHHPWPLQMFGVDDSWGGAPLSWRSQAHNLLGGYALLHFGRGELPLPGPEARAAPRWLQFLQSLVLNSRFRFAQFLYASTVSHRYLAAEVRGRLGPGPGSAPWQLTAAAARRGSGWGVGAFPPPKPSPPPPKQMPPRKRPTWHVVERAPPPPLLRRRAAS